VTLGGAAQQEQFPLCPLCGVRILGGTVSLSVGDTALLFCGDGHGCRRRAVLRVENLLGLLARTDAEAGIITRKLRREIWDALGRHAE
jgi:hypothetical protein